MALQGILLFPPFRLDADNQQPWRESAVLPLRPNTLAVLLYLAQHAQLLVTKQELLDAVWVDTTVSDELLRGYISSARSSAMMQESRDTSKPSLRADIVSCQA